MSSSRTVVARIGTAHRRALATALALGAVFLARSAAAGPITIAPLVLVDDLPTLALDVDATRILFTDAAGVKVKDRATATVTLLGPGKPYSGHLSSVGAIWDGGDSVAGTYTARVNTSWRAKGDWALFGATRQNLATGATDYVPSSGPEDFGKDIDAAGNAACGIYEGVPPPPLGAWTIHVLTSARVETVPMAGVFPVIDGSNIVFQIHTLNSGRRPLLLRTAAANETLDPYSTGIGPPFRAVAYADYWAAAGWVAYTKVGSGTNLTAWTRSPGGTQAAATTFDTVKAIRALNGSGEIVYDTTAGRFLGRATATGPSDPEQITLVTNKIVDVAGTWYILDGSRVWCIDRGTCGPVGGPGDGGVIAKDGGAATSDAGSGDGGGAGPGDGGPSADGGGTSPAPSSSSSEDGTSSSSDDGTKAAPGPGKGGCAVHAARAGGGSIALALGALVLLRRCLRARARRLSRP